MILGLCGICFILSILLMLIASMVYDDVGYSVLGFMFFMICFILFIVGCFTGFINYPKTEGTHTGVLTAVDLEGIWFRRYEIYLKSGGYNTNAEIQSDETKYCLYENETDLKEQLENAVGKKVKLTYGHDGGHIDWKSCGTYHIKSVEILEEEND